MCGGQLSRMLSVWDAMMSRHRKSFQELEHVREQLQACDVVRPPSHHRIGGIQLAKIHRD